MTINLLLLIALTISALWSVLKVDLVKAAIALALASTILSIILFRLASPLAAVFELSVCAGLITVIFMSTISLTKLRTALQEQEQRKSRNRRYAALPVMLIAAVAVLVFVGIPMNFTLPQAAAAGDVRSVLWNERQLDLVGQILVILAGFFGISVLFNGKMKKAARKPGAAWVQTGLPSGATAGEKLPSGGRTIPADLTVLRH